MRPQQQNRRMRGRNNNNNNNNNNRKGGPNPLTRSYESNGPDVKIRGNAQQIAEKYAALARDAMSSGDRVIAENYLQHAEHYNRIIAAAQAQMPIQNFQQQRDEFEDEDGEEGDFERSSGSFEGSGQPQAIGNGPQPVIEGVPAEVALNGENGGNGGRDYNNGREDRRDGFRSRRDRNRDFQNGNRNGDYSRRDQQTQPDQQAGDDVAQAQPVIAADDTTDSLPDFLTGGARSVAPEAQEAEAPRRSRRPRRGERTRADTDESPAPAEPAVSVEAQPVTEAFVATEE